MAMESTGDTVHLFDTAEPVPMTVFYDESRNKRRPTLQELRYARAELQEQDERDHNEEKPEKEQEKKKDEFGMWDGVFARCLLNIFGVIMFLRLGWVVAEAGIILGVLIIFVSSVVTFLTSLSLSAICTNGVVKGGGAYYLISRSLGAEFGGAIGVLFSIANAVAVSLYLVGFAETVASLLQDDAGFELTPGGTWDLRVYGLISLVVLLVIALFGVEWVVKVGIFLLGLLVISIISVGVGSFVCCSSQDEKEGFVGYGQFVDNLGPSFSDGENFFTVLSVFFPAVTGIMAGANISGDLKDAQKSLPIGTLLSVVVSFFVYSALALIVGATCIRDLPSDIPEGEESNYNDPYGLRDNYLIQSSISIWEPLLLIGIFAATLSSALACLNGAPRVFQAVASDGLFPKLEYFAVGRGPNQEPDRGYVLTFIISGACILIGNLNIIAAVITNFFLISYAFINYACFAASMSETPGWRPSFHYYNKWMALLGAITCIAFMFLIDWISAIITCFCFLALYKYLEFIKPDVNWGSAGQAKVYLDTVNNLVKLDSISPHIKTYRPQILLFVRNEEDEKAINRLEFTTKCSGGTLTFCTNIQIFDQSTVGQLSHQIKSSVLDRYNNPLSKNNNNNHILANSNNTVPSDDDKVFYFSTMSESFRTGWRYSIQLSGIGKLRPNIVFLGFKEEWNIQSSPSVEIDLEGGGGVVGGQEGEASHREIVNEYVNVLREAFDFNLSVGLLRGIENLDPKETFKGRIDVYWLVDDGGLTILLPHILQKTHQWKGTSLRVLSKGGDNNLQQLTKEHLRMTRLLHKFRIRADVKILDGMEGQPSQASLDEYESLVKEPQALQIPRTLRYLRLGELIKENSSDSDLVVITLPVPDEDLSSVVYMSWLHFLSQGLPRVLLIRGNNESVITHLS